MSAAQQGVVHRVQLRELGIGRGSIVHRLSVGRLHPVAPSVFAVGHPVLAPLAAEIAALLQVGGDSVLSHETAAALWGFASARQGRVVVTLAGRHVREPAGLRLHRVAALDIRDVGLRRGLPLTAPARTLLDLAAVVSTGELERALAEARVLRLVDDPRLAGAIERAPGRSGVARLRALLAAESGPALTRSEAERALRRLVRVSGLPEPRFNARVNGFEVDALWAAQRIVVEVDGFAFHGHRAAFERDRRRDQRLAAAGWTVLRVTWRQLRDEPVAVAVALARADRSAPAPG
ncbi:MAG: DUF559 domain-containing protein [Solirubrobacteraceae bacterium]